MIADAVSESKKAVSVVAARHCFRNRHACRTSAVGQELFHPGQFDSTGALLRDTNIYTVEVHNHGAARFSVEVNVNPGW